MEKETQSQNNEIIIGAKYQLQLPYPVLRGTTCGQTMMAHFDMLNKHFLSIGDNRCHYIDEGAGAPVLMVHGNPTWSYFYRHLVTQLADRYHTIAPDLIGFGLSDKPSSKTYDYCLRSHTNNLSQFIGKLRLSQPINLVMHGWGAAIGMGYAVDHPDNISSLTIFNGAAFPSPANKKVPKIIAFFATTPGIWLARNTNIFPRLAATLCATRKVLPRKVKDQYCSPYKSPQSREAMLAFVNDLPVDRFHRTYPIVSALEARLAEMKNKPMLIIWGGRDFICDQSVLDKWKTCCPWADIHTFPDCGFYICEDAKEQIADIVPAFLDRIYEGPTP